MIGDIILQRRSGIVGYFVSLFTRSEWVHVGIEVADGYIRHVDWRGKRVAHIKDWEPNILVLTPKTPLTPEQQIMLRRYGLCVAVRGYDFWSAVQSWFWKNPNDEQDAGKRFQCAEFVSAVYRGALGIDLVPNKSDSATQPQDFLLSPFLVCEVQLDK